MKSTRSTNLRFSSLVMIIVLPAAGGDLVRAAGPAEAPLRMVVVFAEDGGVEIAELVDLDGREDAEVGVAERRRGHRRCSCPPRRRSGSESGRSPASSAAAGSRGSALLRPLRRGSRLPARACASPAGPRKAAARPSGRSRACPPRSCERWCRRSAPGP